MSTRSGKRIHSSFHETSEKAEPDALFKSERKTRNKRSKENEDNADVTLSNVKKRQNYVSYPIEDEPVIETAPNKAAEVKSTRKIKRYTLKEHDTNAPEVEIFSSNVEAKKATRATKRSKKLAENIEDVPISTENAIAVEENEPAVKKNKKNKKKKSKDSDINDNHTDAIKKKDEEIKTVSKKSKKKKKKGKQSKTSKEPEVKTALNETNTSTDSFHSAAGSPQVVHKKSTKNKLDATFEATSLEKPVHKDTTGKGSKKKTKSTKTPEKCEVDSVIAETNHEDDVILNRSNTIGKDSRKGLKSSRCITGCEEAADSTKSTKLDSTFDRIELKDVSDKLITTVEREPKIRRSLRSSHSIVENIDNDKASKLSMDKPLNSTFEKTSDHVRSSVINLDSTFDKSNPKLNSTFDKNESKIASGKSLLVTSDEGTVNLTYDKVDNSRISITSDESKTENIVNTTPVLIESSMDESHVSTSKDSDLNVTKEKDIASSPTSKDNPLQVPITPLKREGTFTKETAEVTVTNQTPTKTISLPSPGCTPFHTTRSSQKSVLNVTRSLEKRRSSLVEAVQRQTKVMFCSPVNNPLAVTQQKRKVIKSSMKGSNKSFVFEEKEPAVKPAARKRSYTHNDADDRSTKRKRLAEDLQQSVDRLSRPRTSSASAKLTDTPNKKDPTPSKPKSDIKRTKLPNFAALHQKEFAKMESLDECVDRKAKRARQLLTPNGAVTVLDRSPRIIEPALVQESVKETKKSEKPDVSPKLTKLPTLESLRPGYTRFGFKMNSDVNPFSIPSKKDIKTTEKKPQNNRWNKSNIMAPKTPMLPIDKPLTRQPTFPSLNGTTTARKEAAKQTVLREKSFTSLSSKRDVKRSESRTIIKGVRTNRRFELQMKMRNID